MPVPPAENVDDLVNRLSLKEMVPGTPIFIRIFKASSELEIWALKDGTFSLFETYSICHWSGGLGPKLLRGDKQAPEGFYTVNEERLHRVGRWPGSLNLGYPNALDRVLGRTGSAILIHGGCNSIGCFAMTSPLISEIWLLTLAAMAGGQEHIPVHVFPFRMTEDNFAAYKDSEWVPFWRNLQKGYDLFERTRTPPVVSVCNDAYEIAPAPADGRGRTGPVGVCRETAAVLAQLDRLDDALPAHIMRRLLIGARSGSGLSADLAVSSLGAVARHVSAHVSAIKNFNKPRLSSSQGRSYRCSPGLASCRRFLALQDRALTRRVATASQSGRKRLKTASRN
ncbi:MAG: L,D-transpeptidase family protein [Hyphomicrobium sp.]